MNKEGLKTINNLMLIMEFQEYYKKFEKMQEFMVNDLRNSTAKAQANFLVAMGIFNYIEILGAFYKCNGNSTARFDFVFENLLSAEYKNVFDNIKHIASPYSCLKCGMVHDYFVETYFKKNDFKISYEIKGVDSEDKYDTCVSDKLCGLEFIKINQSSYQIIIYNPRFVYDLNHAFELYKSKLASDFSDYRENFIKRCEEIKIENFN